MNKCFDNKEMKKCSKDYRKVRGIVFLEETEFASANERLAGKNCANFSVWGTNSKNSVCCLYLPLIYRTSAVALLIFSEFCGGCEWYFSA